MELGLSESSVVTVVVPDHAGAASSSVATIASPIAQAVRGMRATLSGLVHWRKPARSGLREADGRRRLLAPGAHEVEGVDEVVVGDRALGAAGHRGDRRLL